MNTRAKRRLIGTPLLCTLVVFLCSSLTPVSPTQDFSCAITGTEFFCGGCEGYTLTSSITMWSDEYCGGCNYSGLFCVQYPSGNEECFPVFSPLNGMECGTRSSFTVNCPSGNGWDPLGDPCKWWFLEVFTCGPCPF